MPACMSFYSNAAETDQVTGLVLQFAVNHPCGAGHFPGNPIIPGALLLNEVLSCIADSLGNNDLVSNWTWQVKSAKFPQPVRPGDTVHVNYSQTANGEIRFVCTVSNHKVMSGIASLQLSTIESSLL
jgi:3-hydroxyacyl-[acyl-carrier-protein] dehydratase